MLLIYIMLNPGNNDVYYGDGTFKTVSNVDLNTQKMKQLLN